MNGQNLNLAIPIEIAIQMWNNHYEGTSISLQEFYNLHEHIISIDELYCDIAYFLSNDVPKKVCIEGYIADIKDIDPDDREITINNSLNWSCEAGTSVVLTNFPRMLIEIEELSVGDHVKATGKILTPIQDGVIQLINANCSRIVETEY